MAKYERMSKEEIVYLAKREEEEEEEAKEEEKFVMEIALFSNTKALTIFNR